MQFLKTFLLGALTFVVPASAATIQKRDTVDVFIWGSANFNDYTESYTFNPGECQAITAPSSGSVGSATVDENASCNVYASSDCSGNVAGTFSAPGISDTGSLRSSFGSVVCTIPGSGSGGSASTTSTAASEPTDVCDL
ncbi:hypothetical protein TSTA_111950 [Talaromyces stipitatus ATCC 10500]|uniref:GPI anchored cell wall protein n=1 Tax=Talaromyces stipitatus (strain ATCC 10500 / CBS 375.48 / QM 6759 / NRRL 1006) TaxID=441959 RepID=B8M964_TALSN|nr:uncharacterized protein TSTA_111950 [Talaromyces stipitatus ATCC 10500]EED17359.1 hypothetical protein TSTA_111950 [Talaromyces stipitatus ATCC 10500]